MSTENDKVEAGHMTPEQIEIRAMRNDLMPPGLELPEQLLFMAFRHLHACTRAGIVTRDQAHAEKIKLLNQFSDWMRWDEIYRDTCKMRVELAGIAREMTVNGCPICKRAIAIIDGRPVEL